MSAGHEWDAAARVLELREEREQLEARLAEISSDVDREVVSLIRAGVSGRRIAEVCGWSPQRVSQLRRRALGHAEPDLGPGEAELRLHRSEVAARGGRASGVSKRTRAETRAALDAYGIDAGQRSEALRFVARQMADELRPMSRDEALGTWVRVRELSRTG